MRCTDKTSAPIIEKRHTQQGDASRSEKGGLTVFGRQDGGKGGLSLKIQATVRSVTIFQTKHVFPLSLALLSTTPPKPPSCNR